MSAPWHRPACSTPAHRAHHRRPALRWRCDGRRLRHRGPDHRAGRRARRRHRGHSQRDRRRPGGRRVRDDLPVPARSSIGEQPQLRRGTRHPQRCRRPTVATGDGVRLHRRGRPSPDRRQRIPAHRHVRGNARSGTPARHPGTELHRRRPALRRRNRSGRLCHRGPGRRSRWRSSERRRARSSTSPWSAPTADGFATVFDCAAAVPTASNVNYTTGRDIPNNTISKLSPSGTVCIYTDAAAHLLVDVNGYAS